MMNTEQKKYLKKEIQKANNNLQESYKALTITDIEEFIKLRLKELEKILQNYKEDIDHHFSYTQKKQDIDTLERILFHKCQKASLNQILIDEQDEEQKTIKTKKIRVNKHKW